MVVLSKGNYNLKRILFDFKTKKVVLEIDQLILEDGVVDHIETVRVSSKDGEFQNLLGEMFPKEIMSDKSPRNIIKSSLVKMIKAHFTERKVTNQQIPTQQESLL